MTTVAHEVPRRSKRVFHRVRVQAAGRNRDNRKFRETTETIVVNVHGGLIYLTQTVEMGAEVVLTQPETLEEQECRVVFLGEIGEKGQRVGLEFVTPAPRFWGLELEGELSSV